MQDFILVHRKQNGNPLRLNVPIWSTCLREIAFLKREEFASNQGYIQSADEIFEGDDGIIFLLHVICGLKSPVLGETEVQGQFKKFVSEQTLFQRELRGWGEALLVQAKKIRGLHLENLGSSGYGSWLRKRLFSCTEAGVVGSGQFVEEILPWLKGNREVHLYARSLDKCKSLSNIIPTLQVHPLHHQNNESSLVIAAPVSNAWILDRAKLYRNQCQFVDFRGESSLSANERQRLRRIGHSYIGLQQILKEIASEQSRAKGKIVLANREIHRAADVLRQKLWLRPGGWEDLCG